MRQVRDGDKRNVQIKEGDPMGKHVVIVDDLVQSGNTLIECQKVLSAKGAQGCTGAGGRAGGWAQR